MKKLGYASSCFIGSQKPQILGRIEAAFSSIYRKQDLATSGHIGVFMYRDVFARIRVPRAGGLVSIKPFDHIELTPVQLRIIQTEPKEITKFLNQFCDVADVQYGGEELNGPNAKIELVGRFVGLSRLHLHAAAAIVTGGYDYRGAVQSALLATELGLKAGAAAQGLKEKEIKDRFNHSVDELADFAASHWVNFDVARVKRVTEMQPHYVLNRYSPTQPDRREVGGIIMGAQYVVAEVIRQMSDRDFRKSFSLVCTYPP